MEDGIWSEPLEMRFGSDDVNSTLVTVDLSSTLGNMDTTLVAGDLNNTLRNLDTYQPGTEKEGKKP
jgi:hypothetical protein